MQRYFLEPESHAFLPAAPAIIPGVRELVSLFKAAGRPVVFTRHLNTSEDAGMMGKWWQHSIRRESPFSELYPELDTTGALILEKTQYDAFHQTRLQELLELQGVRQLVVTGVMTHLCCETTARAAFVRGFEPFFTVDGTATVNEDFHKASLRSLGHGFASLVTVENVVAILEGER
jgi:bifunctional isochorismate lyase / aryl carrier protein